MKKNYCIIMLTGGILLGLTACGNYEPLVSRDGAVTGSAVSGNSVTSVASGGAVEGNSRDRQSEGNEGNKGEQGETIADSLWGQMYRNCNSNKMYHVCYQRKDDESHLVQTDLNGREKGKGLKQKELKTKADDLLWVTDEWIYIRYEDKVYRIPLRIEGDQKESLDTANKECIISDVYCDMDDDSFCVMDENDIYYLNKEKKVTAYHISDGVKREGDFLNGVKWTWVSDCYITDSKVFVTIDESSLYCIHRDSLQVERVDSCGKEIYYGLVPAYMEETGEIYFTREDEDYCGICDTELYVYDGNTTRRVVSKEEINDVLCKELKLDKKAQIDVYFDSYSMHSFDEKIYIEYAIEEYGVANDVYCGVLVYDRNGRIYEEKELARQAKKQFNKKDGYYYNVCDVQGELMYIENSACEYSYNLKTGEMKKVPDRMARLLDICESYNKADFCY